MSFAFRLEDYARYLERAGDATYLDVTRRTDPARVEKVWDNLRAVVRAYGAPWIVQLWTKDAAGVVGYGKEVLQGLQNAGTTLAAHVTVTGLGGTSWEPLAPSTPFHGMEELIALVGRTAPYQMALRSGDPNSTPVGCIPEISGTGGKTRHNALRAQLPRSAGQIQASRRPPVHDAAGME